MRRDRLLLAEMIDAASEAIRLANGRTTEQIEADRVVRDALLWNFTVLGEASAQVSESTKLANPDVPWRLPVGIRNRVVHGYWSVDVDILLTTATASLPAFVDELKRVLAALSD